MGKQPAGAVAANRKQRAAWRRTKLGPKATQGTIDEPGVLHQQALRPHVHRVRGPERIACRAQLVFPASHWRGRGYFWCTDEHEEKLKRRRRRAGGERENLVARFGHPYRVLPLRGQAVIGGGKGVG